MAHIASDLVDEVVGIVAQRISPEVAKTFERCFTNTLDSTVEIDHDGMAFMVTGDIPAMWLRDSFWQLTPYLRLVDRDPHLADLVAAVSRRQLRYVLLDPYANAFNAGPDAAGHQDDRTAMSPWVWERKYEVDSLCSALRLASELWRRTGRTDHLEEFPAALEVAIRVWRVEQDHEARSPYTFERPDPFLPTDTLARGGRGPRVAPTGMTWSGFRPSDDATTFGYNVPGNAFAVVALREGSVLAQEACSATEVAEQALALATELDAGIRAHGVVTGPDGHDVLAYEVDGLGGATLMDDANLPSLLSLPMLGWIDSDDDLYRRTRDTVLSSANPYWFSGRAASGVGSPHTPGPQVWPIALAVQGLTSDDRDEKLHLIEVLLETDAGTGLMHESFHMDDPGDFTRPWFSWANAMFCDLVLDVVGVGEPLLTTQGDGRSRRTTRAVS